MGPVESMFKTLNSGLKERSHAAGRALAGQSKPAFPSPLVEVGRHPLGLPSGGVQLRQRFAGLQRTIGNQAVLRLLSRSAPAIQRKLAINQPGDQYEQEADRVAEPVMRMPDPVAEPNLRASAGDGVSLQRKCAECEEEEKLHRRESGSAPQVAPPIVHQALQSSGRPMDSSVRTLMEQRLSEYADKAHGTTRPSGDLAISRPSDPSEREADRIADAVMARQVDHVNRVPTADFKSVRIHDDALAGESAQAVNALAYTVGSDIFFAPGQHQPGTPEGQRLLAHELVHVGQQANRGAFGYSERTTIHRHTAPPCPPGVTVSARPKSIWQPANDAIEQAYCADFNCNEPGGHVVLVGSMFEYGGSAQSPKGIQPPKGISQNWMNEFIQEYRGVSRQLAPDIIDFTDRVIYEIKPVTRAVEGLGQLATYYALADALTTKYGGEPWTRTLATWFPPHVLPLPGALNRIVCTQLTTHAMGAEGLILYSVLELEEEPPPPIYVPVPELARALILAMLLAYGAKQFLKGKMIPGYNWAAAAAALVLLISAKAHAKLSLSGEDPIVALFKQSEKEGAPIPPEVKDLLDKSPEVENKLREALSKGGDPKALESELIHQIGDDLRANADKLNTEEATALQAIVEASGADKDTHALARKALDDARRRAGEQASAKGPGPKDVGKKYPAWSSDTRARLRRQTVPAGKLLDFIMSAAHGIALDDKQAMQLIDIVESARLTDEEVQRVIEKNKDLQPPRSAEELFSNLRAQVASARSAATAATAAGKEPVPVSGPGKEPPKPEKGEQAGLPGKDPKKQHSVAELVKVVREIDFSSLNLGEAEILWNREEAQKNCGRGWKTCTIDGFFAAITRDRVHIGGYVRFTLGPEKLVILNSSFIVDTDGKIIYPADALIGEKDLSILQPL